MKKIFGIALILGVAGALVWLIWIRPVKAPEEEQKPEAQAPVRVAKIVKATLRSYVVAYGIVEPEPAAAARLAVSVPGIVTAVHCVEGQHVEKDALLFEVDSRAALLAVNFAEKSLERQKKLAEAESASRKSLQEAEQQVAAARAQLALLQVRAPMAGVIARVNVKAGEAADLTTVLAELVDLDRLVVTCNIASADLSAVKKNQPVEVSIPDSTNVVTAVVGFISSQVDPKTDSGVARVKLPAGSGFRVGQFVKARVATAEHKDCLAAPLASVAKDPSGGTFIALVEGEKATLKPVKTGLREGDLVEIEGEGVEEKKTVVTEGAYGLIATQQFATTVRIMND